MTWCKYGSEFWDQLADAEVSDAAARTHAEAIAWLYQCDRDDVTDLRIPARAVRRFAGTGDPDQAVKELVTAGLWLDHGDRYELVHHAAVVRASLTAQRNKRGRDQRAAREYRRRRGDPDRVAVSADGNADAGTDHGAEYGDGVSPDADRQTDRQAPTPWHQQQRAHARASTPPGSGAGDPEVCVAEGCDRPPRRACATCWAHAQLEPAR